MSDLGAGSKGSRELPTQAPTKLSRLDHKTPGCKAKPAWLLLGALALFILSYRSEISSYGQSVRLYGLAATAYSSTTWFRLSANRGIAWSSCPDLTEFECGYLSVPMDYTNPLPNETVSLALRRLRSTAPKKDHMGTLFVNPGGPGGSGTAIVAAVGPRLSTILKGRYDILSWDPRGVNMTTPSIDCFPTDFDEYAQNWKEEQMGFPFQALFEGGPHAELTLFKKTDAYYRATIASCGRNGDQKMLQSLSTAFNVRDMVRILEALGEDKRGLQYWGFSYGTILGATFSAMFPELVHRVLLDGVSSANSYTTDMFEWGRSGMDDTNNVFTGFLTSCAKAGSERCAFTVKNDTADDIRARYDDLVQRLLSSPLTVPYSGLTSGIVTASDAQQAVFRGLYAPRGWPGLATALADAYHGDGTRLADIVLRGEAGDMFLLSGPRDPRDNVFNRHMTKFGGHTVTWAIMCSDTDPSVMHASPSASSFRDYSHELRAMSMTGEYWARWVGMCRLWNTTATEAYRGPWLAEEGLRKTKYPVIFLGVKNDPVTPLSAARSMSQGFGNDSATLLIQDGYGHCSTAHPSLCTAKTIAKYFLEGKVPEYGTTCISDENFLFPPAASPRDSIKVMSEEDRELMDALEGLAENIELWGA